MCDYKVKFTCKINMKMVRNKSVCKKQRISEAVVWVECSTNIKRT